MLTHSVSVELNIPRDRQSGFDPQLLPKYQGRLPGFDDKTVSMYSHSLSTRKIVGHLQELYGFVVPPDLIAVVYSQKGFQDAINAVLPETTVQTRIVHPMRNSRDFCFLNGSQGTGRQPKSIYAALHDTAAKAALTAFEASSWGRKCPAIGQI